MMNLFKQVKNRKAIVMMVSLALVLVMAIGGTLAYLIDSDNSVVNKFLPSDVPNEITEDFDGTVKKDVAVTNNGNVSAFVRAKIVVTWQDASGNVGPTLPVLGTDYSMDIPANTGWVKQGDYYYYTQPVAAKATTGVLIAEAKQLAANEGYQLSIDILTQSVQSEGVDDKGNKPVELAWGVDIVNGNVNAATIVN